MEISDYLRRCRHAVTNYMNRNHPTVLERVCAGICVIGATELALRTLHNLWQVISRNPAASDRFFGRVVSSNIGGMVALGACATNEIPGLATLGGVILSLNALSKPVDDALIITKAIRAITVLAVEVGKTTWKFGELSGVNDVITRIYELVVTLVSSLGSILGRIFMTVLPSTPESQIAVIIILAIAIYKLAPRLAPERFRPLNRN